MNSDPSTQPGLTPDAPATGGGPPGSGYVRELAATPQQQSLWFLDQLDPGNPAYNVSLAFEIQGPIDEAALEAAFQWVVGRHETFCTSFALREAEVWQRIEPVPPPRLERHSVTDLPVDLRELEARMWVQAWNLSRYDLAKVPLIRACLVRLDTARFFLCFSFHSITIDHASVLCFGREYAGAYAAYLRGARPETEKPAISFSDFTAWQEKYFQSSDFPEQLDCWARDLENGELALNLPFDRPRPAAQTFRGEAVPFCFTPALSDRLRASARESQTSLLATLVASYHCLLSRYSGQAIVITGTPFANRTAPGFDSVLGCCMNMLPLRTDLGPATTFAEARDLVHRTFIHAQSLQSTPLRAIIDRVKPKRDPRISPLFQTTFTLQEPPMKLELSGVTVTPLEWHPGTIAWDMAVRIWDAGDRLAGVWEFNSDLFDKPTLERMVRNFEAFLDHAIQLPEAPWRRIPMVSPSESVLLLESFNATARAYPVDTSVMDLVREQALRDPAAAVVHHAGRTVTRGDLLRRAEQLGYWLRQRGVRPGDLVGLYVHRSIDMIASMMAILDVRAAYLPLDPAFPKDRLAFMMEDSRAAFIVTQKDLQPQLPPANFRTLILDAEEGSSPVLPTLAALPDTAADPDPRVYVRYTSGSTGRPKGVEITRRSLLNFLLAMQSEPGFHANDVLLAVTTLSFDISELEIWLPLISGGQLVLASRMDAVDGKALLKLLDQHRVTVLQATPATWRLLYESGWKGSPGLKALCGGEALPAELATRLAQSCGQLWNMYGPTETTVWSSVKRIDSGQPVRVGGPTANTQFYVADLQLELVPLGVFGELLIGGDGLARGYLNRSELTTERFVHPPFLKGKRVYRTGDLVRWRPDATLEFHGRLDTQVKVRGYRIELDEVESELARQPGVRQAVATVRDDQLIAYFTVHPGVAKQNLAAAGLRDRMRTRLPEYMVPSMVILLETIPLTPNGKVDRKALPAPGSTLAVDAAAAVKPSTEIERKLVSIWEEVLKRSPIGVTDLFFDLGGHSLLAATMFAMIERRLGVRIPLASLFQSPTIAQLARLIEESRQQQVPWNAIVPIRPDGDQPPLFLVHGAGGNVLIYRDLAAYITPGVPIYGLQSLGLDGLTRPLETVEAMADAYVGEIKRIQPSGPYRIGGYCMGGQIAFEIAQRLSSEGSEVSLLALLDSVNFNTSSASTRRGGKVSEYTQLAGFHIRNLMGLSSRELVAYIGEKARMFAELAVGKSRAAWGRLKQSTDLSGTDLHKINDRAGEAYLPKPYRGFTTLIKPVRTYSFLKDPALGWSEVTLGGLDTIVLELNPHAMLIKPYVHQLADALNSRLEKNSHGQGQPPLYRGNRSGRSATP